MQYNSMLILSNMHFHNPNKSAMTHVHIMCTAALQL